MEENDPKQVIMKELCIPFNGLEARKGTFQFFRFRSFPGFQMHEITFENNKGQPQRWLCFVRREADGTWCMIGGNNITGSNHFPRGGQPRVRLTGSNIWMGGYVIDSGRDVSRVCLISNNGYIVEDAVQDGLVLFIPEQEILFPIQVKLYDRAGNLVGTHPWPHFPFLDFNSFSLDE